MVTPHIRHRLVIHTAVTETGRVTKEGAWAVKTAYFNVAAEKQTTEELLGFPSLNCNGGAVNSTPPLRLPPQRSLWDADQRLQASQSQNSSYCQSTFRLHFVVCGICFRASSLIILDLQQF